MEVTPTTPECLAVLRNFAAHSSDIVREAYADEQCPAAIQWLGDAAIVAALKSLESSEPSMPSPKTAVETSTAVLNIAATALMIYGKALYEADGTLKPSPEKMSDINPTHQLAYSAHRLVTEVGEAIVGDFNYRDESEWPSEYSLHDEDTMASPAAHEPQLQTA